MTQTITDLANSGVGRKGFGTLKRSLDPDATGRSYNSISGQELGEDGLMTPDALMDETSFQQHQQQEDLYSDPASNNAEALFNDENPNESVLDVLTENSNIDFEPDAVNIEANEIDCTKPETDAVGKNERNNGFINDAEEKMDDLETFWNDHQAVAQEYLEAAYDNLDERLGLSEGGISRESAVRQIMPQGDTGKGSAAANTVVPGAVALDIAASVNDQRNELTRDQKRALIEETVKIAQSKPELDSEKLGKVLAPGSDLEEIQENLARLSSAKMEMLLTQTAQEQPEYQLLEEVRFQCLEVRETQLEFASRYGENVTFDKIKALDDAGNTAVANALDDSRVYKMGGLQAAFSGEHIRNLGLDTDNINLSADSEHVNNFNLSSIASELDAQRFAANMPIFQNELDAYAKASIK